MPEIELSTIQEKLRVNGRQSTRAPFIVGIIRRVLWPFIRSYHFITLEWVRDAINQQLTSDRELSGGLRALRAEMLALSRRYGDLYALIETQNALIETQINVRLNEIEARPVAVPQSTDLNSHDRDELLVSLQQAEFRLSQIETTLGGQAAGWSTDMVRDGHFGVAFPIGDAVCCRTPFGPMIMKRGDLITNEVIQHGSWDTHLLIWLKAGAKRGSVAVDAGAHFGSLSCAMALHFKRVHSFEPNLANYVYLCANASLRPTGRIIPHNIGLYSYPVEISLAPPDLQEVTLDATLGIEQAFRSVDNTGGLAFSPQGSGVNTVSAITLDSLNLSEVGFIKVDCQGSDGPVIIGAMETIRRCRPIVVFEWEEHLSCNQSITLEKVRTMLEDTGYRVQVAKQHNEKQVDYVAIPQDCN